MGSSVKITPVKNRLGQKLSKPGGIKRADALEAAGKNVESLREEFIAAIPGEIAALETIFAAAGHNRIAGGELERMLRRADQLLTLSGTYGYDLLDVVVRRFCDFATAMIDKNLEETAPVGVHLRAMRLVCPGGMELSREEADHMLAGLAALHRHYEIERLQNDEAQAG